MRSNYEEKLDKIQHRLSHCRYSNSKKCSRKLQPTLVVDFQVEKYDLNKKGYLHPNEREINGFIQIVVNYFELPPFVAERTKFILAFMWKHHAEFIHNMTYENVILGIVLSIVQAKLPNRPILDITNIVINLYSKEYDKHIKQIYIVSGRVSEIYFNGKMFVKNTVEVESTS